MKFAWKAISLFLIFGASDVGIRCANCRVGGWTCIRVRLFSAFLDIFALSTTHTFLFYGCWRGCKIKKLEWITILLEVPAARVHPRCANAHNCFGPTLGRWWNFEKGILKRATLIGDEWWTHSNQRIHMQMSWNWKGFSRKGRRYGKYVSSKSKLNFLSII